MANPGPRRVAPWPRRAGVLDDIQLMQPATIALRARYWQLFEGWFEEHVGSGALDEVLRAPVLLIESLRMFGQFLYSNGTPLHYFRQLLAHVQREFIAIKPFMGPAWQLVTK